MLCKYHCYHPAVQLQMSWQIREIRYVASVDILSIVLLTHINKTRTEILKQLASNSLI